MDEKKKRIIIGKINCIWSKFNVDIEPFFVVLDSDGKVAIARSGNNLSKSRQGSTEEAFRRASMALAPKVKKEKGGSKIYWQDDNRQKIFCHKISLFRSHHGMRFGEFYDLLCKGKDHEEFWKNFVFVEKDALAAIEAVSTIEGKIEFLLQNDNFDPDGIWKK